MDGVIRLTNISDFIAPNLDCIIPLETKSTESQETPAVRIHAKVKEKSSNESSIKISLADCLACNGCITSAETVLVQEQSLPSFFEGVRCFKMSVVSVSPQAVCSIAAKKEISVPEAAKWISAYFISLGVRYVVDSSFGRQFSLSLLHEELSQMPQSSRPVISSACPGFVCYAEKNNGELLTRHLSKIRSPQAVQGALVKDYLAKKFRLEPSELFHASVMPCFDKKLEATRQDFLVPGTNIRETDCVISSAELYNVLEEFSPKQENVELPPNGWLGNFSRGVLVGGKGGTSGGYAENVVQQHLNRHGGDVSVRKNNRNMEEITVSDGDELKLKVARVYGFRNIQNVVRKLKASSCGYDYIEVMACPSGCGNGGGQIREITGEMRDSRLNKVEELYDSINQVSADRMREDRSDTDEFREVSDEWEKLNNNWRELLYTAYRAVSTNAFQKLQW